MPPLSPPRSVKLNSVSLISAKLLQGWTMLADGCPDCQVPLLRQRATDASALCVNCDVSFTNGVPVSAPVAHGALVAEAPAALARPSAPPRSAGGAPAAADADSPVPRPSPAALVRPHARGMSERAGDSSPHEAQATFGEPLRVRRSSGGDAGGGASRGGGSSPSAASRAEALDAVILGNDYQGSGTRTPSRWGGGQASAAGSPATARGPGPSPVLLSAADRSLGLGGPAGDGAPVPRYSWGSPAASSDMSSRDAISGRGGSGGREAAALVPNTAHVRTSDAGAGASDVKAGASDGGGSGSEGVPGTDSPTTDARLGPFARCSSGTAGAGQLHPGELDRDGGTPEPGAAAHASLAAEKHAHGPAASVAAAPFSAAKPAQLGKSAVPPSSGRTNGGADRRGGSDAEGLLAPPRPQRRVRSAAEIESDRVSAALGARMLQGWALLDSYCPICNTPLVRSRQGVLYCVGCQMEVRSDASSTAAVPPQTTAEPAPMPGSRGGNGGVQLPEVSTPPPPQPPLQQQQRGAADAGPALAASVKRMHSPVGGAAMKLPRLERAAAPVPADIPAAAPAGLAAPPRGDLQPTAVVRTVTQTLLAKMLQMEAQLTELPPGEVAACAVIAAALGDMALALARLKAVL